MKRLLLLVALSALLAAVACSPSDKDPEPDPIEKPTPDPEPDPEPDPDPDPDPEPYLTLSTDSIGLPANGGEVTIQLTSNGSWSPSSSASWLTFAPRAGGKGDATITLSAEANTGVSDRRATFTVRQGALKGEVIVIQPATSFMRIGDDMSSSPLAFPGAEGGGRFTTGGRGGRVYIVTNLNDAGPGSLREAVEASGPRTVVFEVSGTINLTKNLSIRNPHLTIAGQTAPGDGICLRGYELNVGADNVIIRFLRIRLGDDHEVEADAFGGRYATGVIVDHCSASWSVDECVSFYANTNFTMQWCISSESLRMAFHSKGGHGYGGIWGGKNASFHHNIMAHHDSRTPRIQGVSGTTGSNGVSHMGAIDLRNNVIFNWGGNSAYGGENQDVNFVNCYYKGGATGKPSRIFSPDADTPVGSDTKDLNTFGRYYVAGNYVDGQPNATNDNWNYGVINQLHGSYTTLGITQAHKDAMRAAAPHPFDRTTTHTAQQAYERVVEYAGASLSRDAVDKRIAGEIRSGVPTRQGSNGSTQAGIIDRVADAGGYPNLQSRPAPPDTDRDGMPDAWEEEYGLNKNNAADGNLYTVDPAKRYTNLEAYLHSLVVHIVLAQNEGGTPMSSGK